MTGAAAPSLGTEGFAQQNTPNYVTEFSTDSGRLARSSRPADHVRHGCCLDPDPRTGRGVKSLMAWGRDLDTSTGELRRNGRVLVVPRRCMSWSCFCCAVVLRARARKRVYKGAAATGRVFMLTLTIDPRRAEWRAFRNAELKAMYPRLAYDGREWEQRWRTAITRASIRYVSQSWNRMATNMRRDARLAGWLAADASGAPVVPFVRSLELQKNGRAHLHVLIRVPSLADGFAHIRTLRELAVRAGFGGGMGFDMQAARSRSQLAAYVTKGAQLAGYVTKGSDLLPRHSRRFAYSRSWCEWTPPTRIAGWWDWRLAGGAPDTVTRALAASGFTLDDPGRYRVKHAGGSPVASPAGGTSQWPS